MQRLYDGIKNRGLPVETLHATSLRVGDKKYGCLWRRCMQRLYVGIKNRGWVCRDVACNVSTLV